MSPTPLCVSPAPRRYAHRAGRAGRPGCASDGISLLLVPVEARVHTRPSRDAPAPPSPHAGARPEERGGRQGAARRVRVRVHLQAEGKLADLERSTGVIFQRIWSVGDEAAGGGVGGRAGGGGGGAGPAGAESAVERVRGGSGTQGA